MYPITLFFQEKSIGNLELYVKMYTPKGSSCCSSNNGSSNRNSCLSCNNCRLIFYAVTFHF